MKKIHRTVSAIIAFIIVGMCIVRLMRMGTAGIPVAAVSVILGAGVIAFVTLKDGMDTLKKYVVACMVLGFVVLLLIGNGFSTQYHYLFMAAIAIAVLYFDSKFFLVYSLVVAAVMGFLGIKDYHLLLGENARATELIPFYITLIMILLILYFMTAWGEKNLQEARDKQAEAAANADKVKTVLDDIKQSVIEIEHGVSVTGDNVSEMDASNQAIMSMVTHMRESVDGQFTIMHTLNERMGASIEDLEIVHKNSDQIISESEVTYEHIHQGMTRIQQLEDKMQGIHESSVVSGEHVVSLAQQIDEVNELLKEIQNISKQTNMLALNASIEAARAGEAGRGFAVVASSIGELATQSNQIVDRINGVNSEMSQKSKAVSTQVEQGISVTEEGKQLAAEVSSYFSGIQNAIKDSNQKVSEEIRMIQNLSTVFNEVRNSIDNLTTLLKDSTLEMGTINESIKEQGSRMNQIGQEMDSIKVQGGILNHHMIDA